MFIVVVDGVNVCVWVSLCVHVKLPNNIAAAAACDYNQIRIHFFPTFFHDTIRYLAAVGTIIRLQFVPFRFGNENGQNKPQQTERMYSVTQST